MQVVYDAGNMLLSPIWEAFRGPVNDVVVCRDLKSPVGARYTLLVVRDRACVKQMLTVFDQSERVSSEGRPPYLLRFAQGDELCFVFEYREERKLSAFAAGQMTTPVLRETVAVNLVMECLSSPLPYPLLQLVLTQDCVQIEKDNSVYFTPLVNLSELDPSATEAECAACCAQLLLSILEPRGRGRLKSYELIRKKSAKRAYSGLPELYHDVKVTSIPPQKQGWRNRLKAAWLRNKDRVFRLLLVLCVAAVLCALVLLISQLIFGDIPLFRLFEPSFEVIGTETLN